MDEEPKVEQPKARIVINLEENGNGGKCRNFRIGYDLGLPTTMPATNS